MCIGSRTALLISATFNIDSPSPVIDHIVRAPTGHCSPLSPVHVADCSRATTTGEQWSTNGRRWRTNERRARDAAATAMQLPLLPTSITGDRHLPLGSVVVWRRLLTANGVIWCRPSWRHVAVDDSSVRAPSIIGGRTTAEADCYC